MADTIGSYVYRITGDTSDVNKGIKETQSTFESAAGKIKGACLGIAAAMGISFGVDKFISLNKEMAKLAAEAEASSKRFGNTFPDALDKASKAVVTLQEKFNYGDDDAQKLMATLGVMAQQMGLTEEASVNYAESMAGLGADLASYFGESEKAEEMTNALMSATKGMTREAKGLGLYLDDDHLEEYAKRLGKTTNQLNSAERATAVLAAAQKQMNNMGALGSAGNSLNSYSTAMYRMSTAMDDAQQAAGAKLLPVVAALAKEMERSAQPGGVYAGVLDQISDAGETAASVLASLLNKLNNFTQAQTLSGAKQSLDNYNQSLEVTKLRINASYGSFEKLNAEAKKGNADAKLLLNTYNSQSATIEQLKSQVEQLTKSLKLDETAKAQEKINNLYKQSENILSSATRTVHGYGKAYEGLTLEQAAQNSSNITAQQTAISALKRSNDLRNQAYELQKKFNVELQLEDKITSDKPKKHKELIKPTSGKSGDDDLKKQIQEAEAARIAILGINAEVLTLAQTISQLDAGQLKDLKANLDLDHASDGAKKFVDAFSSVDITKLNQSLLNDSIDKNISKWGASLKSCGDSAKAITIAPSIISEIDQAKNKTDEWKDTIGKVTDAYGMLESSATSILNSLASITANQYANEIAALDRKKEKALEVAGVSEDSAVESAEKSYQLALKSGNSVLIASKKNALTKAKIDEDYEKKKSDLEFKAAFRGWEYKEASAIAEVPLAVGRAIASASAAPWPSTPAFMASYAALAGLAAGAQLAAVTSSKPKRSSYESGGIIPGNSFRGDNVQANVNSGEMILNAAQQAKLFELANGKGSGSTQPIQLNVYLPSNELWFSQLYSASQNGDAILHPNGLANR